MKKSLTVLLSFICGLMLLMQSVQAANKKYESWNQIIEQMDIILNESYEVYVTNNIKKANDLVNNAYFGFYEKHGVERAVMSYISGRRGTDTEYQFAKIKRLMSQKAPNKIVRNEINIILKMLHEDANELDGKKESRLSIFLAALIIILREGTEAILIIAAISAYLVRTNNIKMVKVVYKSSVAAIIASIISAFVISYLFDISGANQEIIEGVTMLVATVVLFFVSNWMFSKAETHMWKSYIDQKIKTSVASGSAFAIGTAAFLAVFREGAETILFYQAMITESKNHLDMILSGLTAGCLMLVIVFIIIRYGSIKLPLKPFFIGTSFLMYLMAISFAGNGIKELQEADVVSATPIDYIQSVSMLGIYPTVETMMPQLFMLIIVIASIFYYKSKSKI